MAKLFAYIYFWRIIYISVFLFDIN